MIRKIINDQYFMLPGDMIVTRKSLKISTVLGSCVSVCIFDSVKQISGMNHYMLPSNTKFDEDLMKYGDTSLALMLEKMTSLGSVPDHMKASVFGGSSMFKNIDNHFNIGKNNLDMALSFLKNQRIAIDIIEAGGYKGRKIQFDTSTGEINFKFLSNIT